MGSTSLVGLDVFLAFGIISVIIAIIVVVVVVVIEESG